MTSTLCVTLCCHKLFTRAYCRQSSLLDKVGRRPAAAITNRIANTGSDIRARHVASFLSLTVTYQVAHVCSMVRLPCLRIRYYFREVHMGMTCKP